MESQAIDNLKRQQQRSTISGDCSEHEDQISRMKDFADSSQSEMIYAVDEYGNEVALGILIQGPFTDGNEKEEECFGVIDPHECNNSHWVAAEEECVSSNTQSVQNEIKTEVAESNLVEEHSSHKSDAIKVYKVDRAARKTLKKWKIDVRGQKEERKTLKVLKKVKKCSTMPQIQLMKKKAQRNKSDKAFPIPTSTRSMTLNGKYH